MRLSRNKLFLFFSLVIFYSISLFFYFYHNNYYDGEAIGYLVSDSKYYFRLAQNIHNFNDLLYFSEKNKNLFGIFFYYDILLFESRALFYLITSAFFLHALMMTYDNLSDQQKKNYILILLLLNPAIFAAFSGPNKEILGFISALYFINFIIKRNYKILLLALFFSVLTRAEYTLLLIFLLLTLRLQVFWRTYIFIFLLFLVSFTIFFLDYTHLEKLDKNVRDGSLGFVRQLSLLNSYGLYFLNFLPKILLNMFGSIILLNPFAIKGYSTFLYASQLLFLFLTCHVCLKKRFSFRNDFFYVFIVYAVIFSVPAFVHHRYFIPIYPVFVFLAFYNFKPKVPSERLRQVL